MDAILLFLIFDVLVDLLLDLSSATTWETTVIPKRAFP